MSQRTIADPDYPVRDFGHLILPPAPTNAHRKRELVFFTQPAHAFAGTLVGTCLDPLAAAFRSGNGAALGDRFAPASAYASAFSSKPRFLVKPQPRSSSMLANASVNSQSLSQLPGSPLLPSSTSTSPVKPVPSVSSSSGSGSAGKPVGLGVRPRTSNSSNVETGKANK